MSEASPLTAFRPEMMPAEPSPDWLAVKRRDRDEALTLDHLRELPAESFGEACLPPGTKTWIKNEISDGRIKDVALSAEMAITFRQNDPSLPWLHVQIDPTTQTILFTRAEATAAGFPSSLLIALTTLWSALHGDSQEFLRNHGRETFRHVLLQFHLARPEWFQHPSRPRETRRRPKLDFPHTLRLEWLYVQTPRVSFSGDAHALSAIGPEPAIFLDADERAPLQGITVMPEDLANAVYLKFEGLPLLTLKELYHHPASGMFTSDSFDHPDTEKMSDEFRAANWFQYEPAGHVFRHPAAEVSAAERAIFSWIDRLHHSGIAPIYVGASAFTTGIARQLASAYLFRGFQWVVPAAIDLQVTPIGPSTLQSVQLQLPTATELQWARQQSLSWQPETGQLAINPQTKIENAIRGLHYQLRTSGHANVAQALRRLRAEWTKEGWPTSAFPRERSASVRPQVWLTRAGTFRFSLAAPDRNLRVWNFPPTWNLIFQALTEGVHALTESAHTDIATRTAGEKRKRDLKVLKHAGISRAWIARTLAVLLGERDFSANSEEFWRRMGQILEPGATQTLEALCGKRVNALFQEVPKLLRGIFDAQANEIIDRGDTVPLEGAGAAGARVVLAILRSWAAIEGPDFFASRAGLSRKVAGTFAGRDADWGIEPIAEMNAPPPVTAKEYSAFPTGYSQRTLIAEFLGLGAHGFDVFWEGKPVAAMADGDFRMEVEVRDETTGKRESDAPTALDWFELHPAFFLRGVRVSGAALSQLAADGLVEHEGVLYRIPPTALPQLQRLEAFWARLQKTPGTKDSAAKRGSSFIPLPRSETLELLSLLRMGMPIQANARFARIQAAFDSLLHPRSEKRELPKFQGELKTYQWQGLQWLLDLHALGLGGILADDMGLGKTVQVLAFLSALHADGKIKERSRVLIVVPTSLVGNWKAEAARFTPDVPFEITTYGMLVEHEARFLAREFDLVIFDEAQALKNLASQRTRVARSLKAGQRFAMTGTPMENHWGEFYSILDLVCPGGLGGWPTFQKKFLGDVGPSEVDVRALRDRTRPLMLRRTKGEVLLDLPAKIESKVLLEFEAQQKKIYRDTALSWSGKVRSSIEQLGETGGQLHMLTALMRLRQICSDPSSAPGVTYAKTPPKLEWIRQTAKQIHELGESALIFGQFIASLEKMQSILQAEGISTAIITGAVPRAKREKILHEFKSGVGSRFLLMTLKTGGVGLNLTRASHVIHLEPWWNPAAENQGTDRAHRLGQENVVQVHRLIMEHSVEEKIEQLQRQKQKSFDALVGATGDETGSLEDSSVATTSVKQGRLSQADFEALIADD